jgi:putative FmdB family regulatory protein
MPTYEYVCRSCGTHVEVYQHFNDAPLTECGVCGGPLRKVFHPAGILFKGSGFYATDSRRRSAAASGDGKGDEGAGSGEAAPKASGSKEPAKKGEAGKESTGSSPSSKEKSA